jgi:hypothetical protein
VVANKLGVLERTSPQTFNAIHTGIQLLREYGADPGLNRFKRLKHTGGVELWEMRIQAKPAYRVLFAPVPGHDAFVLLQVVAKADIERSPDRHVAEALSLLAHWIKEVLQDD